MQKTKVWIKNILFCFMFLIWACRVEVKASDINENTKKVSFATTQVKAGEDIKVKVTDNTGEESYVWMVDDTIIENSGNSYIPTTNQYNSWITVQVYDASENMIGSDTLYFSKLPVLYIDTDDGEGITEKTTYKSADMYIQGNDTYSSQYNGKIQIKGRGNTSWAYSQKPYKIKLDKSTNLFGFGKNKHWVLLSNYLDQSMMRNVTASQISSKLGLTTMEMTWVDVCMNGYYIGCYELCEHIRIDSTRVDIFDWEDEAEEIAEQIYSKHSDILTEDDQDAIEELLCTDLNWITTGKVSYNSTEYNISDYYTVSNDISGGYLFELSEEYDEVSKFTTENGMKVMINSPEYLATNETMMEYAKEYWKDFEDALCSIDGYNSKGKHYSELAEFDSMVKYWLIMEIMGNNDAAVKSRYAYKDCGEKLVFGPAWDFDWGAGCIAVSNEGAQGWKCSYGTLWKEFTDDPYFFIKAGEEYWKIRDYLEQIIQENGIMDSGFNYIKESGNATEVEYPDSICGDNYIRLGFEGDAQAFKTYMRQRIQWMDEQFLTADNIVCSLYNEESTNPYVRAIDTLVITLENAEQDSVSKKLIADGVILENTDMDMKITANDDETESVNVYVNGKSFTSVNVNQEGSVVCTIDSATLTTEVGSINVISVVGKNAQGNTTYTNFTTLLVSEIEKEEELVEGTPYKETEDILEYDVTVPHVIINQVYGGKKEIYTSHSFIELYNPTDKDIDLSDWSLQYRSSQDGDNALAWVKYELSGVIKAKSSYLVRCKEAKNPQKGYLEIKEYDESWNQIIHNKGFSVILLSNQKQLSEDTEIFDNATKQPLVKGYVDLFAVSGNDELDTQIAPAYETVTSAVQSKKKTVRRVQFRDTDNNSVDGDMEQVDYSFASDEYIAYIAPRSSVSGPWSEVNNIMPTYDVIYESNGGSEVVCATYPYYTKVEKPENPVKENYIFAGWYSDKELVNEYDFSTKPTKDITLYASWIRKIYEVKWIDYDGTVLKTESVEYGCNGTEPESPKRSGYTFIGWSAPCENIKENLEIKALYESIDITVTISGTYNKPVKNKSAKKVTKAGVTSITLYTQKYKTAKLEANVVGVDKPVNWTSSKSSVAKVSKDGKVTARKAGTAYIIAEVDGVSAKCKIVVKKAKITVKIGKKKVGNKTLNLKVSKKYTLKTTIVPEGKVTYKVKNKKILKISSKGKITTLKKGTTTITVSANGMKKKIKVKVK